MFYFEFRQSLIEQGCKILKYEDLCLPDSSCIAELRAIIGADLSMPVPSLLDVRNVTGDIDNPVTSRGGREPALMKLARRPITQAEMETVDRDTKASEICRLLNYEMNTDQDLDGYN